MLKRLTREQMLAIVAEELKAGNYRSIAERVKASVKRDPLLAPLVVPLLAAELIKVGDRNPGRFGRAKRRTPTKAESERSLQESLSRIAAEFEFDFLTKSRDILDGRLASNKVALQRAEEELAAARLGPNRVTRQQFRPKLREFLARKYKIPVKKVSELTRRKNGSF